MEYICKFCNKQYKSSHSRSNHYRIYHSHDIVLESVKSKSKVSHESVKSKSKVSQELVENNLKTNQVSVAITKFFCQYCNNIYKHKQSKYTHEKKCKNHKKNETTDIIINELKKENVEIKNILNNILTQCKIHPKTLQKINKQLITNGNINNSNINNNTVNNGTINNINNINIVKFGTEDIASILSKSEILQILNRKMCSLEESIKAIHFNDKRPELQNIYITNLKDQYAYIFDGKKFIAGLKSDILGELIDNHVGNIEYSFDEYKDKLPDKTIEVLDKFIDKMNDDESEFKDKEHKIKYPNFKQFKVNIIKLMIYNESENIPNILNVIYDKIDNK